jgi:hypothetical protein
MRIKIEVDKRKYETEYSVERITDGKRSYPLYKFEYRGKAVQSRSLDKAASKIKDIIRKSL